MRILKRTRRFKRSYQRLPISIQKKVKRQLSHLAANPQHPSLYVKKVKGTADIWEARVDIHHRMTFQVTNDAITLRGVGPHDILKNP